LRAVREAVEEWGERADNDAFEDEELERVDSDALDDDVELEVEEEKRLK
jgi:hypothetical protein